MFPREPLFERVIDWLGSVVAAAAIVFVLAWFFGCATTRAEGDRRRGCELQCASHRGQGYAPPIEFLECMERCQGPVIDERTGENR